MALPGKVLQYLACGLPTIAIDLDGLQSLIPPNHGILYVSDLQEMATTVKQLMSDEVFLKDISHLGVSHMIRHFNWEKQISSFENLLFSCCNE
jgi:glycosyltransferase involved in cell wall biosynthesis